MGIAQVVAGQRITASVINQLPVVVSYMATGSLSNSTTETALGTFTIPAGDPTSPGGYWWWAFCQVTESGTPNVSIRVRLNSTSGTQLLNAAGLSASLAASSFGIDGRLGFSAIGASGAFGETCELTHNLANTGANVAGIVNGVSINTTVSNTILVTAQFSAASTSNTAAGVFGAMYRL